MTQHQCKHCPWKAGTNPDHIPNGYSRRKHRSLTSTIAKPGALSTGPLHIMACHESPIGDERPCVGWLHNQLNDGNNITLRYAVVRGHISGDYQLDGPQHPHFRDTLPGRSSE